jgi:hypothetical protein
MLDELMQHDSRLSCVTGGVYCSSGVGAPDSGAGPIMTGKQAEEHSLLQNRLVCWGVQKD